MNDSHLCRAGSSCSGRRRNTDTGEWTPQTTILSNTICPRCIQSIDAAAHHQLWQDYCALRRMILEPTQPAGSEIRSGEPKSQVPINVMSDALMHELVDAVYCCAEAIADQVDSTLHATWQLDDWLRCVEYNVETLIAAPPRDVLTWNRAGDNFGPVQRDGVQLALALLDIHRRATAMIGIDRPRERMPVPCPKCESPQLGRDITTTGLANINCRACGSVWTEAQYRALTQIGAQILREGGTS